MILRQGKLGSPVLLNGKTVIKSLNGGKHAANDYTD